ETGEVLLLVGVRVGCNGWLGDGPSRRPERGSCEHQNIDLHDIRRACCSGAGHSHQYWPERDLHREWRRGKIRANTVWAIRSGYPPPWIFDQEGANPNLST